MNNRRRRLLMLCCSNTSKKTRLTDQLCPSCQIAGVIRGVITCAACGLVVLKQCTDCGTSYCNKCGCNLDISRQSK
jgi:hypothetical protein